jgi:hypothetical protein
MSPMKMKKTRFVRATPPKTYKFPNPRLVIGQLGHALDMAPWTLVIPRTNQDRTGDTL